VLIQPWYNFSQTVTYNNNNNVFLPADTKSIVYKHTHSAQRWLIKTERFTTALEAESPVSSEISDFTPYAHAQSQNRRQEVFTRGVQGLCLFRGVDI